MKDTSLRSNRTRVGDIKTENEITLIQLLKRKLRNIMRILNDSQRIVVEILRKMQCNTLEFRISFDCQKVYSAYTERIVEKDSGQIQEISGADTYWISDLSKWKRWKIKDRELFCKLIRMFTQKVLFDRKKADAGTNWKQSGYEQRIERMPDRTNLRILIMSGIVPSKISGSSEVFA